MIKDEEVFAEAKVGNVDAIQAKFIYDTVLLLLVCPPTLQHSYLLNAAKPALL